MILNSPYITGSLTVTGNANILGALTVTGSLAGTASFATTASNALTASSADNLNVRNNLTASNAVVSGTLTAQTLVVQTITASIEYSSGSNRFGSQLTDRQTFTGSLNVTGSSHFVYGNVGIGTISPSVALHVANGSATTTGLFEYTGGANSYIGIKSTSGTNYVGNVGYDMTFEAGGSQKMVILSAGNVGI